MRLLSRLLCLLLIAGCTELGGPGAASRAVPPEADFGPIKTFQRSYPEAPRRANADIARDFLDLHFALESGRTLPRLTRFEGPITLRVIGQPVATLETDLTRLLTRLRREAGIDITRVAADAPASITVQLLSSSRIRRVLPNAACFVVPNVADLDDYSRKRRSPAVDWSKLETRTQMALFVPNDISPQELRDCLHEELAQALGPLNDLYRLPDSIFNDDNVNTVLTGFDMLILRTTYAPELRSGMSRETVAARLPAILARLNPNGVRIAARPLPATPNKWKREIETALGPGQSLDQRVAAARNARRIAIEEGWQDHRRAFSEYSVGLLTQRFDAGAAQAHYTAALQALGQTPGTAPHRAMITAQTAAFALALGRADRTLDQTGSQIPVARRAENAVLLATLMLLRSEALAVAGRPRDAEALRVDSLGWARYGFGPNRVVQSRLDDIAALVPQS